MYQITAKNPADVEDGVVVTDNTGRILSGPEVTALLSTLRWAETEAYNRDWLAANPHPVGKVLMSRLGGSVRYLRVAGVENLTLKVVLVDKDGKDILRDGLPQESTYWDNFNTLHEPKSTTKAQEAVAA